MKLIIAGSRGITSLDTVAKAYYTLINKPSMITEIVSGGARGVDKLGEQLAGVLKIPVKVFPAEWDRLGKSAGYRRNEQMATYADALLAIWDGESKGTGHMISIMQKQNKPVYIYTGDK